MQLLIRLVAIKFVELVQVPHPLVQLAKYHQTTLFTNNTHVWIHAVMGTSSIRITFNARHVPICAVTASVQETTNAEHALLVIISKMVNVYHFVPKHFKKTLD